MPASQWPGMLQMKKYLPARPRLKTVAPSVCVTAPALSHKSYCCLFTLTTLCASALYTNSATHKTSHRYTHTNSWSVLPQSHKQSIPRHTHTLQRSLEQFPAAGRLQYCRKPKNNKLILSATAWRSSSMWEYSAKVETYGYYHPRHTKCPCSSWRKRCVSMGSSKKPCIWFQLQQLETGIVLPAKLPPPLAAFPATCSYCLQ